MGFLSEKVTTVKTPDGVRDILNMPDSVCFAIMTKDNYVIITSQYRAVAKGINISIYGGYIDEGETIEQALYREMFEESNISKKDVAYVDFLYKNKIPSMGICTEKNSLAIVHLNKTKKQIENTVKSNDEEEDIKPMFVYAQHITQEDIINLDGLKAFLCVGYIKADLEYEQLELIDGYIEIIARSEKDALVCIYKYDKNELKNPQKIKENISLNLEFVEKLYTVKNLDSINVNELICLIKNKHGTTIEFQDGIINVLSNNLYKDGSIDFICDVHLIDSNKEVLETIKGATSISLDMFKYIIENKEGISLETVYR